MLYRPLKIIVHSISALKAEHPKLVHILDCNLCASKFPTFISQDIVKICVCEIVII